MSKIGRPRVDTEQITVRLPRDLLNGVDALRKEQDNPPTRPEAIRDILRDWLRDKGYLPQD